MKKIVFESLNEIISFERKGDPLFTLGIGKRKLIENWLEKYKIEDYKIENKLIINVYGRSHVDLKYNDLIKFPEFIQFDYVNGRFDCSNNKLITLKGCPKEVGLYFSCSDNQLTSLKYCPKYVSGSFGCFNNKIKFSEDDVKEVCKVRGNIYIEDF